MTLKQLRRAVAEGGGLCRMWLVYREDRHEITAGQEARLRLLRAFWQQAEAVAVGPHCPRFFHEEEMGSDPVRA